MMKPILEIKNISKKFRIQHNLQPYLSLRDSVTNFFRNEKSTSEEFYALKDVSFNVEAGDSIGIIGKNGAGKSTLLKILSKITPPSSGSIISRGRIASLLEVGTGFHPELTGRENIFLNGSILGMKRKEIQSRFDEIVDFSGTEKFLDTPLKHYSSGMQLRLAFSVAAFLEPEILIIDEVLAVGDLEFQKKCMGKMEDVSKSGRTVLFVSHQLGTVNELCKKAICLRQGVVAMQGETKGVVEFYIGENRLQNNSANKIRRDPGLKNKSLYIKEIFYSDERKVRKTEYLFSEDIFINFEMEGKNIHGFSLFVNIVNSFNTIVFSAETPIDTNFISLKINKKFLTQGSYYIKARIHIPAQRLEDNVEWTAHFSITDLESDWLLYNSNNFFHGSVMGNYNWIKE